MHALCAGRSPLPPDLGPAFVPARASAGAAAAGACSGSPSHACFRVSAKPGSMAGPSRDMRSFAQKASGLQRMRPVRDTCMHPDAGMLLRVSAQ